MAIALDSNILVYAEGLNGADLQSRARQILLTYASEEIVIPVQALGELYTVLTRKGRQTAIEAPDAVLGWKEAYTVAETSVGILTDAMELTTRHSVSLRDAIMVAVAANSGCHTLLSEDMQDGFVWRGVTVHNPFKP